MLTTIVAGAFVLGVVVLVHEFGHFIVAKSFGVFVKTFSIGFGRKILRKRWGETEYTLSLLPFGGYVKFAGESELYDDEESQADTVEDMGKTSDEIPDSEIPRERYFTTKRPIVRAAVLVAGPFMNYVAAVLIYIGVVWISGSQVTPSTVIGAVEESGPADSVGLVVGDEIVAVDGVAVADWSELVAPFVEDLEMARMLSVRRHGQQLQIEYRPAISDNRITLGFEPYRPSTIGRVQKSKPAYRAGIREGATIEAINGTPVSTYGEVREIVHASAGVPR